MISVQLSVHNITIIKLQQFYFIEKQNRNPSIVKCVFYFPHLSHYTVVWLFC